MVTFERTHTITILISEDSSSISQSLLCTTETTSVRGRSLQDVSLETSNDYLLLLNSFFSFVRLLPISNFEVSTNTERSKIRAFKEKGRAARNSLATFVKPLEELEKLSGWTAFRQGGGREKYNR